MLSADDDAVIFATSDDKQKTKRRRNTIDGEGKESVKLAEQRQAMSGPKARCRGKSKRNSASIWSTVTTVMSSLAIVP